MCEKKINCVCIVQIKNLKQLKRKVPCPINSTCYSQPYSANVYGIGMFVNVIHVANVLDLGEC